MPRVAKKRKLDTDEPSSSVQPTPTQKELPEDFLRTLAEDGHSPDSSEYRMTLRGTQRPAENDPTSPGQYITNPNSHPATLSISNQNQPYNFHLPPKSTFSLSNCAHSTPFRHALRSQASTEETPYHFDMILLDPPWPNRSIKRTHQTPPKGSNYTVFPNLSTLTDCLHAMDLDMLMSPSSCVVGVWITNKPAIRETVLHPEEGLFAAWGIEWTEEWIWLKTTAKGEPVSSLEGVWRKPYEVLLVGRRRRRGGMAGASGEEGTGGSDDEWGGAGGRQVKRRVILGVPDLHSRKPRLKGLAEEILLRNHDRRIGYRALEVFARNLVAGWWSWGDECVKFNWEGYWRSSDETETQE
ncbi:hypothetical protein KC356_g6278 [Hortaea werneckii]|nr:hypothetical protein KC356_g6278 [Hortaea werneckii]